jgi:hypothetical protein
MGCKIGVKQFEFLPLRRTDCFIKKKRHEGRAHVPRALLTLRFELDSVSVKTQPAL